MPLKIGAAISILCAVVACRPGSSEDARHTSDTAGAHDSGPTETADSDRRDYSIDAEPGVCDRDVPWSYVEAGYSLTCGIHTDGCAECWGISESDAVSPDVPGYHYYNEDQPPAGRYVSIDLAKGGDEYYGNDAGACGVTAAGAIVCWAVRAWTDPGPYQSVGVRDGGVYGLTTAGDLVAWDRAGMPSDGSFREFSVGDSFALAVQEDGQLRWWRSYPEESTYEGTIPGSWAVVDAGDLGCAVDTVGDVDCWDGPDTVDVDGTNGAAGPFVDVCVTFHSEVCAIDVNGLPVCWSMWPGSTLVAETPVATTFTQISCGSGHACGLTPDGEIECWGANEYGECDPPV